MIFQQNIQYRTQSDLDDLPGWISALPRNQLLIQVFSGIVDETWITELSAQIVQRFHGVALLGTTTAGEIIDGQSLDQTVVISFTGFEHSTVCCALVRQNDDQVAAARNLATNLRQPVARAIIAFGCGIKDRRTIFGEAFLNTLKTSFPEAVISGGQAGDNGSAINTLVFTSEGCTDRGFAAVSIAGEQLTAHNAYSLSWIPIGRKLTITHAVDSRVFTIDGRTPYDIYSHYLGKEVADGLPLSAVDFPLMIERDGVLMAIHAMGVNADGSFDYIHHFRVGEQLRFGYCHAGLLALGASVLREKLSNCNAQVAFIYSCVSRKWILGEDILVELEPISTLAPCAGFFCYGEYFGRSGENPLFLSQTLTVLCLSEASKAETKTNHVDNTMVSPQYSSRQFKTMRVLHRLVETSAQEIESMNQELASLARKDSLTRLFNRRSFDEQLEHEIKRSARSGASISLIMLDIDHFKLYNDTYGHVAGDECLRSVSQTLQSVVRRASDLVARYGGEEFVVTLPETPHDTALMMAEEIRQSIEHLCISHKSSPTSSHVTASFGVITVIVPTTNDIDPSTLVALVDEQLYKAKSEGRNRVVGEDMNAGILTTASFPKGP